MPTPSPAKPFPCPTDWCGALIMPPPVEEIERLFGDSMGAGVVLFKGECWNCGRKLTSRFPVDGKEADKGLSIDK